MTKPKFQVHSGEQLETSMRRYGEYDAADMHSRELANWTSNSVSGDVAILPAKEKSTARAKDIVRNNGYASRALQIRIDNLVGHNFKLSYRPNWRTLGVDANSAEAKEFVSLVEAFWKDYAEDPSCPIDAEGKRTFTQIIRAGVYSDFLHGEILNSAEWITRPGLQTAIKIVNPDRLSNPINQPESQLIRGGVRKNSRGAPLTYYIRHRHPSDIRFGHDPKAFSWKSVRQRSPWGRLQIIHLFEAHEDGQTRGITKLAPILKRFKMLDKWQDVKLQSDVVNAMYAMVIESEFDTTTALEAIGADFGSDGNVLVDYLKTTAAFHKGANVTFDGVKIPHLFPNEKLHMLTADNQNAGELEDRLLRYIAAGGNFSYEQLSSNWSQTNFSSAKASLGEAWRFFLGEQMTQKQHASLIFGLVLEEMFSKGLVTPPKGAPDFWSAKSAWCKSDWIGPGKTMIDGLKEVKELVLKLESGLITYEKACAILGEDYTEIFDQQVREVAERKEKGLPPPSWALAQNLAPDAQDEVPEVNDNAQTS